MPANEPKRRKVAAGCVAGLIGAILAGTAGAAPAILNQGMNLRAGPGVDYPLVASLPPGTPAEIFGCLQGWSWCDVEVRGLRGWMAGPGLQVLYEDQPEPLASYGGEIGLPFIGFAFGDYWHQHYRDRPWFSDVDRWQGGRSPGGPGGYRGGFGSNGPEPRGPGSGPQPGFAGRGPAGAPPGGYAAGGEVRRGHGPDAGRVLPQFGPRPQGGQAGGPGGGYPQGGGRPEGGSPGGNGNGGHPGNGRPQGGNAGGGHPDGGRGEGHPQ